MTRKDILSIFIPCIDTFCLSIQAINSAHIKNINGESGQPCLEPRVGRKMSDDHPLLDTCVMISL